MQIKITMRYHLTPVRIAIIKKSTNSVTEDLEKMQHSYAVDGNVNWYQLCEKQLEVIQKIRNRTTL